MHGERGEDRPVHRRGEGGAGRLQGQFLVDDRGGPLLGDVRQGAVDRWRAGT
ncbi:hypothetical protein M2164_000964 [Streptomyces sp. SAI-208]|uniref:hypothetical protein n=1 Tax=Streptomyces sp. SAI-208 TaxID=2940550 RepID=UPI0024770090|nr:hypothetical protein [Streptomyces sp. SAI-208]MDH6605329.1 hypothetical protein [Streptomyces sp. SAI-208]